MKKLTICLLCALIVCFACKKYETNLIPTNRIDSVYVVIDRSIISYITTDGNAVILSNDTNDFKVITQKEKLHYIQQALRYSYKERMKFVSSLYLIVYFDKKTEVIGINTNNIKMNDGTYKSKYNIEEMIDTMLQETKENKQ